MSIADMPAALNPCKPRLTRSEHNIGVVGSPCGSDCVNDLPHHRIKLLKLGKVDAADALQSRWIVERVVGRHVVLTRGAAALG